MLAESALRAYSCPRSGRTHATAKYAEAVPLLNAIVIDADLPGLLAYYRRHMEEHILLGPSALESSPIPEAHKQARRPQLARHHAAVRAQQQLCATPPPCTNRTGWFARPPKKSALSSLPSGLPSSPPAKLTQLPRAYSFRTPRPRTYLMIGHGHEDSFATRRPMREIAPQCWADWGTALACIHLYVAQTFLTMLQNSSRTARRSHRPCTPRGLSLYQKPGYWRVPMTFDRSARRLGHSR